jgi:hypothetical protein
VGGTFQKPSFLEMSFINCIVEVLMSTLNHPALAQMVSQICRLGMMYSAEKRTGEKLFTRLYNIP